MAWGLAKLVVGRLECDEASPELAALRQERLALAARVLRALPRGATLADYEARLEAAPLVLLSVELKQLYADLNLVPSETIRPW